MQWSRLLSISIRDAVPGDAATIAQFNDNMARETEGHGLDTETITTGVARLLADCSKGRYWLAEYDGKVVGQIMVTYEWSDWRNGTIWWIQSVYVSPAVRRKGIFSALYQHVESLARSDADACGLRLYVERNNVAAQDTYRHMGMTMTGYQVMEADFTAV
ncbi:MAG: GNAT family N-acetyltransferase [Gammaproteobacteria bacterium]|nr:GNAT family N-acetyltransferase [Gammaproteobacteria bacterium]